MNIYVRCIPQDQHRFTTIGDWWEDGDVLEVRISAELDWRYQFAVLFHELIEFGICKVAGITTVECDAFDALFEREYEFGKWPRSVEAGFDKRCPYRRGHVWGSRFERLVIFLLGASWSGYIDACDKLMGVSQ